MKHFQQFSMDSTTWHATIGSGTLLDDVTKRLYDAGERAMAHGVCPQVGSGGHFTIGGLGPMSRMWGTALDHIVEVQVVLADSSIVRASESLNPDVFFAVRGAAAGFAVVTEFVVRTHPAPKNSISYSFSVEEGSASDKAQTFKNWQSFVANPDLSRNFSSQLTVCEVGLFISGTYFGSQEEFDALNLQGVFHQNLKCSVVITMKDWLGTVLNWTEGIGLHLVGSTRCAFYAKCLAFEPSNLLSSSSVDNLFEYLEKKEKGTALWFLNFELQGGATNDVPVDAAAYAHRDVLFYTEAFGIDIGRVTKTTRGFVTGINELVTTAMPNVSFGCYPGFVDPELPNGQEAYWGVNLPKLERIKEAIDPSDIFHNPQSVRPAAPTNNSSPKAATAPTVPAAVHEEIRGPKKSVRKRIEAQIRLFFSGKNHKMQDSRNGEV